MNSGNGYNHLWLTKDIAVNRYDCQSPKLGLRDFVGYGQPLWLPHTGQAQGQPVHLVSTP
ncbi:MAG: hypothetical protein IPL78_06025 [Chloroflexi bacterium]|nr:hypothetical protein [Chloroflexota bacterium]